MDDFDIKLQELFDNFRRQLPDRLTTCLDAWQEYCESNDKEALSQLRFHTHKLAGAASIYGFENIGNSAKSIELLVDKFYAGDIQDTQVFNTQLKPQINELEQLILAVDQSSH